MWSWRSEGAPSSTQRNSSACWAGMLGMPLIMSDSPNGSPKRRLRSLRFPLRRALEVNRRQTQAFTRMRPLYPAALRRGHVVPKVAICDPELTATLPRHLAAATALDALSHCMEGYLAVGDHPIADALALDGIARISRNANRAAQHEEVATRMEMMWGAFAGGVAIGKGLGPAHAIAISCGDQGIHHGILSALGLVACLDLVEAAVPDRCLNIRLALGTPDGRSLSEDVLVLMRQVGMPTSLSMARYEVVDLERTAAACAQSHFNFTSRIRPTHEQFKMMITSIV